jgi:hypothetical protein
MTNKHSVGRRTVRPEHPNDEGTTRAKIALFTFTAAAFTAAVLVNSPMAGAAPSGPGSAQDTVSQIEAQGNRVILNKSGAGALDDCSVSEVRPGQPVMRVDATGDDNTAEEAYTPMYVTVTC